MLRGLRFIICLLLTVLIFSCSGDEIEPPKTFAGSFTKVFPQFRHDGNPVETDNFIVYSDASSTSMRQQMGEEAEEYFADVKSIFDVAKTDFTWSSSWESEKIHLMADSHQSYRTGFAYPYGAIIRAKDSPKFNHDLIGWRNTVQHEITHVVELLLIGDNPNRRNNAVWLREGMANYGARNHTIQSIEQLTQWKESRKDLKDGGNVIAVTVWEDFPEEVQDGNELTVEYYYFFELSVRYLLDLENGNGSTIEDVKSYYEDLGKGLSYYHAFPKHFGITVSEFEAQWWDLMEAYLNE